MVIIPPAVPQRHQEPSDLNHPGVPLLQGASQKDILVMYQGGGYDGCFWEWNCFMLDAEGEFYNIATSGYAGLKSEDEARAALKDEQWMETKSAELIDLTSEESLVKFTENFNGTVVRRCFSFLEANEMPYVLSFRCETCEEVLQAHVPRTHHMVCSGGLAYSDRDIHCEDCHNTHTCAHCGEFWEDISEFVGPYCEFCGKTRCSNCESEFKEEELKDGECTVCASIEVPNPNQPCLPIDPDYKP